MVWLQTWVSLLQIWLSMEFKRVVGLRRLATTFKPVPLKNLSRQVKFLTLWGFGMSVSSALTRAVAALAALWVIVVQVSLPVVWAMAGETNTSAPVTRRIRARLIDLSPGELEGRRVTSPFEGIHAGGHGDAAKEVRPRYSVGRPGCGDARHQGLGDVVVGSMALEERHKLRRWDLRQDFRGPGDGFQAHEKAFHALALTVCRLPDRLGQGVEGLDDFVR